MSDTSGTGGFGPATRGVRDGLSRNFGSSPRRSAARLSRKIESDGDDKSSSSRINNLLWHELDKQNILEKVLLPPELIFYLKEMAQFIETAKAGGMTEVMKKFGLQERSNFPSLRRLILNRAPGNSLSKKDGSEQHSQAGGAFNAGSVKWAQEFSGQADPTQISILSLVEKIRLNDRYDEALKLSSRKILEEYGKKVIHAFIRTDDPWGPKAGRSLDKEFEKQLDDFFDEHLSAIEWDSTRVAKTLDTLKSFVKD